MNIRGTCDCKNVDIMGVSKNSEYLGRGPYNKDYSNLGSILGSTCLGNVDIFAIYID